MEDRWVSFRGFLVGMVRVYDFSHEFLIASLPVEGDFHLWQQAYKKLVWYRSEHTPQGWIALEPLEVSKALGKGKVLCHTGERSGVDSRSK